MNRMRIQVLRPRHRAAVDGFFRNLSRESRYQRFMGTLLAAPDWHLDRLVTPEPGRQLALGLFAACERLGASDAGLAGIVEGTQHGDEGQFEFAIAIADRWQGLGLSRPLLRRLMLAACSAGFSDAWGVMNRDNRPAIGMARRAGCRFSARADGLQIDVPVRVALHALRVGGPPFRMAGCQARYGMAAN